MTAAYTTPVKVTAIDQLTPLIKKFSLERRDGEPFTPFSAGSHVVVSMDNGSEVHKNPYSLVRASADYRRYEIAVRREDNGRGGSLFMHGRVTVGTELEISHPFNLFPAYRLARKHLLITGGVGITPFMSYTAEMARTGEAFELHYAVRSRPEGAFVEELEAGHGDHVRIYDTSKGQLMDIESLLSQQPLGTHVYVCGPHGMVADVQRFAAALGWPGATVHSEEFKSPDPGQPFTVYLSQSGRQVDVGPRESLLEALERSEVDVAYSCRGGACGMCQTPVVEGTPEHRDYFLTEEERKSNKFIMPCVSRSCGDRLVIDL